MLIIDLIGLKNSCVDFVFGEEYLVIKREEAERSLYHKLSCKDMKPNQQMANEFADKYKGKVVGVIHGNKILKSGEKSRAGYKVEIDGLLIHTYLIKTWHNNRKAISISTEQLEKAVGDHALILMSYNGIEYITHAVNWEHWAKEDGNYDVHTRFGTREVFCKQDNFRVLDLDKYKIQDYYPIEDEPTE